MTVKTWTVLDARAAHQTAEVSRDLRTKRRRQTRRATGHALDVLSPREWEVLNLIVLGKTDRQLADELYLSRITVSNHVSHILGKLEVPNRTAAASVALAAMHNRVMYVGNTSKADDSSR
jgi:DNA-binding NarL/FixJ family response regulator